MHDASFVAHFYSDIHPHGTAAHLFMTAHTRRGASGPVAYVNVTHSLQMAESSRCVLVPPLPFPADHGLPFGDTPNDRPSGDQTLVQASTEPHGGVQSAPAGENAVYNFLPQLSRTYSLLAAASPRRWSRACARSLKIPNDTHGSSVIIRNHIISHTNLCLPHFLLWRLGFCHRHPHSCSC